MLFSIVYYVENCYPYAFEETGLVSLLFLSSLKDRFGCLLSIYFSLVAYFFLVHPCCLVSNKKLKTFFFFVAIFYSKNIGIQILKDNE